MNRRTFLATATGVVSASLAAPALIRLTRKSPRAIPGGFVDDGGTLGHRIRDGYVVRARREPAESAVIVIVGGGVAGLSAAWELQRRGMQDFLVLELEKDAGGNARSGQNDVSAYPWAAHYVPVPGQSATLVRELFEELGVLRNGVWEERHLCFSPQERLFMHGAWHPGLEPEFALDRKGRTEFRRFDDTMRQFRDSGEFTIPMATGVRRNSLLDRMSVDQWMRERGLTSPALRWYVEYACRDDYGALARDTSAWAGIHYFASRSRDEVGPLTWPEGNGWIVARLLEKLGGRVRTGSPVSRIERDRWRARRRQGWRVVTPTRDYHADAVIFAAPSFIAPHVVEGMERPRSSFVYSPWLTANLTLDRSPTDAGKMETPLAWDNVLYDSSALGYVVATHQSLRTRSARDDRTIWTYYWALAEESPASARQALAMREWAYWRDRILADLGRAHPDIADCVARIDIMRHGHAMIRPTVGFLNAEERRRAPPAGLEYAHSDRSGLSLFEEAQYQGVEAARRTLRWLG